MTCTTQAHTRTRRAFTLLELSLAIAVGSVILLAAITVFGTMQKMSSSYGQRADDVHEFERAQLLLRRAFGSVVMAQMSEPREGMDEPLPERSRLMLDRDGAFGSWAQLRKPEHIQDRVFDNTVEKTTRSTNGTETERTHTATLGDGLPRLELAIAKHPILSDAMMLGSAPSTLSRRAALLSTPFGTSASQFHLPEGVGGVNPLTDDQGTPVAVRGVFELVANPRDTDARLPGASPALQTFSLYYRPISIHRRTLDEEGARAQPPTGDAGIGELPAAGERPSHELVEYRVLPLEDSVQILSNLVYLRWVAFQGGKMRTAYSTSIVTEMPAYIELEIVTASGLTAQWMFDLTWTVGAELGGRLADEISEEDEERRSREQEEGEAPGSAPVPNPGRGLSGGGLGEDT